MKEKQIRDKGEKGSTGKFSLKLTNKRKGQRLWKGIKRKLIERTKKIKSVL